MSGLIAMWFALSQAVALEPSLFELKSEWKDQNSVSRTWSQFKGSPTVVGMIYTGCAHACPLTISKLQEIQKALDAKKLESVKFVLASFDVKRDRPEVLKKTMQGRKLDEKRWTFLAGAKDADVRELSVALGISYKELPDGEFSHSNRMTLLDAAGRPVAVLDRLNGDIAPLIKAAEGLGQQ